MNGRIFILLLIVAAIIGAAAAVGFIAFRERDDGESQATFAELPEAPAAARLGAASEPATAADGASDPALAGVEALSGTVESVEEGSLTLATTEGTETVAVDGDTQLTLFLDRSLEDLEEGASVTLMGQRGEQGEMRAAVLLLGDAGAGVFGGLAGAFGAEGLRAGGEQISPEDIAALRAQLGAMAGAGEGGQIPPEEAGAVPGAGRAAGTADRRRGIRPGRRPRAARRRKRHGRSSGRGPRHDRYGPRAGGGRPRRGDAGDRGDRRGRPKFWPTCQSARG